MAEKQTEKKWDVFISHAWEDKDEVARPLAEMLRARGLKVWYDEFTLELGDSLHRSIDRGLAESRYGLVILSPAFFAKEWPQKELDGFVAREDGSAKVILPIWHNIDRKDVLAYSPTLADKLAVSTSHGLENVVRQILKVVRAELISTIPTEKTPATPPKHESPKTEKAKETVKITALTDLYLIPINWFLRQKLAIKLLLFPLIIGATLVGAQLGLFGAKAENAAGKLLNFFNFSSSPTPIYTPTPTPTTTPTGSPSPSSSPTPIFTLTKAPTFTLTGSPTNRPKPTLTRGPHPSSSPTPIAPLIRVLTTTSTKSQTPQPAMKEAVSKIIKDLMVNVPKGSFSRSEVEISVSTFWIGKYEVTQSLYKMITGKNPSFFQGADSDNKPVEMVSWFEAVEFCNRLSQIIGYVPAYEINETNVVWRDGSNGFRLPTEAEWEYACRAGTTGDRYGEIDAIAWYDDGKSGDTTHAVGLKKPNDLGLYDMLGNVWEWCWDWYGDYPAGGTTPIPKGPKGGSGRVVRGGGWGGGAVYCRSADRYGLRPGTRFRGLGFRLARSFP